MITLSIILIILYIRSIIQIKHDSGGWRCFDPFYTNILVFAYFLVGTATLIVSFIALIGILFTSFLP